MEQRKIVKSGNTSYTIALPINWIRKNKLEKGSKINLLENEIGEIVMSADKATTLHQNTYLSIKIDGKDSNTIYFEILNAYLRDYKTIILEGKDSGKIYDKILIFMKAFIGLDIIEQTPSNIIIKNFSSDDKELSPRPLIKKLDIGIRGIFELLSVFFEKGFSQNDFFGLQKIKQQNDRIYFLIRKSILMGIENQILLRTFQTTFHQISKDKVISGIMHQFSSLLESIAKSFLYLEHTKKDIKILKEIFEKTEKEYRLIINVMKYKNYNEIFNSIGKYSETRQNWESFLKKIKNPLMLESITYLFTANDLLNQMAFEIIE